MTRGGLPALLYHLRRVAAVAVDNPAESDAHLLGRFVDSRDGLAFEVLVRRHASLVWNVCRRVLHDDANAEDAFQAAFLTLVRKAHTIGRRASLASWLYRVAYRVAVGARRQAARRSAREVPVMDHHWTRPGDDAAWRELRSALDEEVCRLPEKYRAPVVLCYLQGVSNAEAARRLGCPSGTVVTRLAWARRRLRKRLTQRGLSAPGGLLTAALLGRAEAAVVPPRLIDAAVRASLRLASGATASAAAGAALRLSRAATGTFSAARLKFAVVVAASVALAGGALALCGRGTGDASSPTAVAPSESAAARPEADKVVADEPGGAPDEAPPPGGEEGPRRNKLLGFFERADAAKRTVTFLADNGGALESRTLPVAAGAPIARYGLPARLSDLKFGCKMKLFLSADGSKVVEIRAKDDDPGDTPRKRPR